MTPPPLRGDFRELDAEHQRQLDALRVHNARLAGRLDALERTIRRLSEKHN